MKVQLSIVFLGALILVSGCARKCPPCPTYGAGSTGTFSASPAPDSSAPAASENYGAASSGSSSAPYAGSGARYVNK